MAIITRRRIMETVAGVFTARARAEQALEQLRAFAPRESLNFIAPATEPEKINAVPVTQDMQPVGRYLGAALGSAVGLAIGATIFLPGLGAITLGGLAAAALFGVGGGLLGGAAAEKADEVAFQGFPADEVYLYKDAVRQGRSVVFVMTDDRTIASRARKVLADAGAETVDPARKDENVGTETAERLHYDPAAASPRVERIHEAPPVP